MARPTKKAAAAAPRNASKKPAAKKTTAKKTAAKPAKATPPAESFDDLPPGESEAAFEKYLPIARAFDGKILRYRGGALLMRANAERCISALQLRDAEIADHLPRLDRAAMWGAAELALALAFAARAVLLESPEESELASVMARVYVLRDLLLTNAEGLAKAGIFKKAEVDKIREGRGQPDAAQDCIDLAALYRKYARAIRGKTPVTAAQIAEAAGEGDKALKLLKPANAKRATAAPSTTAADRDRLHTLLVARHRDLRRAGMYFWVDEVDQHVPALLSRELPGRPKKEGKKLAQGEGGKPA